MQASRTGGEDERGGFAGARAVRADVKDVEEHLHHPRLLDVLSGSRLKPRILSCRLHLISWDLDHAVYKTQQFGETFPCVRGDRCGIWRG